MFRSRYVQEDPRGNAFVRETENCYFSVRRTLCLKIERRIDKMTKRKSQFSLREREREREANRQKHRERERERETDRQTERERERERERESMTA